jgi:hypothetical protein
VAIRTTAKGLNLAPVNGAFARAWYHVAAEQRERLLTMLTLTLKNDPTTDEPGASTLLAFA